MRNVVSLSLPPKVNQVLEKAVKDGGYGSKSEFIRHLLRMFKDGELKEAVTVGNGVPLRPRRVSISEIKEKAVPILKKAGVIKAAVFGSVARGEDTSKSDIDILVELDKEKTMGLFGFVGLQHQLEDVLQKKVDMGTYSSINKLIKDQVMKEKVTIL